MQNNATSGIALLITAAALLAYSSIAFLGTEYLLGGNHLTAIALTLMGVVILVYCIYVMCKSKASRNKQSGLPREILSIIIVVLLLFVGSIPFTQFFYIHDHQEELQTTLNETTARLGEVDSLYASYARHRIADYRKQLHKKHIGKSKAKAMEVSLERRLIPESFDTIRLERQEWLRTFHDVSVWSIFTPRKLHHLMEQEEQWNEQYNILSSVIYQNEKAEPFTPDSTALVASIQLSPYLSPQKADGRSMLMMAACCLLILTTYFHIRRPKNRYEGNHR